MAVRTFVFCDICNPMAIRILDRRAGTERQRSGRRITDGRSWYEGYTSDAIDGHGWNRTNEGRHVCPDCSERGLCPEPG